MKKIKEIYAKILRTQVGGITYGPWLVGNIYTLKLVILPTN